MAELTPLLKACPPRPLSASGDQYAANLTNGLTNELATPEGIASFVASSYITKDTAQMLGMIRSRIAQGADNTTAPAVYQLSSRYGGGKTHGLLLLAASLKQPSMAEWNDDYGDHAAAQVIAFDGESHDVFSGTPTENPTIKIKSLSGYLLYQLGGLSALMDFKAGDDVLGSAGAETFERLIGDRPVVFLLDELVHYISKVRQARVNEKQNVTEDGTVPTISALARAVSNSPRAALVLTSPEPGNDLLAGRSQDGGDAMQPDALHLNEMMNKISSQSNRVTHNMTPSGEPDFAEILRRRLFENVDEQSRIKTSQEYAALFEKHERNRDGRRESDFYEAYPFHPATLEIIKEKLAFNRNFQRVRGTLRLLGNTVMQMHQHDADAALIHPYHITPAIKEIRNELVDRQDFNHLDPAIDTDIVGEQSTAAKTSSMATKAAVTMLVSSIAPLNVNGMFDDEIAESLMTPEFNDFGVCKNNLLQFLKKGIYVDDDQSTQRRRFSQEANVMKEMLEGKARIFNDRERINQMLKNAIGQTYARDGNPLEEGFKVILFPSRADNLPDSPDIAHLGIVNPEYWNWEDAGNHAMNMQPNEIMDLHRHGTGNNGNSSRLYPNNAVLLCAVNKDLSNVKELLAIAESAKELLERQRDMPQRRRNTLTELKANAEKNIAVGIQEKFRYLFSAGSDSQRRYPPGSNSHVECHLMDNLIDQAGKGQGNIMAALGDRLLHGADAGLSPSYWKSIPPLQKEEGCTLQELRAYFARTPQERTVIGSNTWQALIANGVKDGGLFIETEHGEINPMSYNPAWRVRTTAPTPHEPDPIPTDEDHQEDDESHKTGGNGSGETTSTTPKRFTANGDGRTVLAELREFMQDNRHEWTALQSCQIQGTAMSLPDHIASIPQDHGGKVSITANAEQPGVFRASVIERSPAEYKDYAQGMRRWMQKNGVENADISITMDAAAAESILGKLTPRDQVTINILFG